ncbi:orotidine-5'-phosphate decarboxylase [Viridibacillus sp. YIM B01967]|uniref:Orotidine 5'-phosphate decarboxylase n=1 Tax=Viridibacillus soli TaxID=2798301 RepID=A0ABS1H5R3_9BACL|nr:orotidine-5'-phosphate decarboxylase [Viridibacillus soli]MBK3494758.1 orotidine-5'-phosphate decarboxylase [Viridibacillus soli]
MFKHNFADRLNKAVAQKKSHSVIGLDPVISRIPNFIREEAKKNYGENPKGAGFAFTQFNKLVIDAIKDHVAVIKPQLAYYEVFGEHGIHAFWETVNYAQQMGLLVIADAKRGDIDSTATAYANAFFGSECEQWNENENAVDSLTINPYLGRDSLEPFFDASKKRNSGLFVLVKTSNPYSGDFQNQKLTEGITLAEKVGVLINKFSSEHLGESGYSSIGAVVGATYPEDMKIYRKLMPKSIFLVPGYGAQGATGKDIVNAFNEDGYGALISASRSIIYSFELVNAQDHTSVKNAITQATIEMNNDINLALKNENKFIW